MIHLVYTSTAVELMDADALVQILRDTRPRNRRRNVTGVLLYRDGTFLGVLEGDKEDVLFVYDCIKRDARRRGFIKVFQEPIAERGFPDWTMGFCREGDVDRSTLPDGYTSFMEQGFEGDAFGQAPARTLDVLRNFRGR